MAFPNGEAILRLFLSLMVTNCSGERSFSRFKRIKNELRTTIKDRLSTLCIESDKLRQINFDELWVDFTVKMARKKLFLVYLMIVASLFLHIYLKIDWWRHKVGSKSVVLSLPGRYNHLINNSQAIKCVRSVIF